MARLVAWFALAALALAAVLTPALAEKRVALVIGNSKYSNVSTLPNPVNDAGDIARSLERLDFKVTKLVDQTYDAMRRALRQFEESVAGSDIALIFFAGHGMEIDRQNYLIPVDAKLETDRAIKYEAISLDLIMSALEPAKGLRLVLLDACRNNPFAALMQMTTSSRSIGRGLSRVEPSTGTLVGFAAKEGTVAADGKGRNSPYTKALLAKLEEPGLELNFLFRQVRDLVLTETNGAQEPFTYGSLPGTQIYLSPPLQTTIGKGARLDTTAVELAYWNSVRNSDDQALLQAYIEKYPDGEFRPLAEVMLRRLAGEWQRTKQEKEAKAQAEKAIIKEKATQQTAVAEATPQTQMASLDKAPAETTDNVVGKADAGLVRQVQTELGRLGCDPGKPDGVWGAKSAHALREFARLSEVKLSSLEPTEELLGLLKRQRNRACPLVCGPRFEPIGDQCVVKICPKGQELTNVGTCVVTKTNTWNGIWNGSWGGRARTSVVIREGDVVSYIYRGESQIFLFNTISDDEVKFGATGVYEIIITRTGENTAHAYYSSLKNGTAHATLTRQ